MRTRVLLIIKIYYLTFIFATTFLSLFLGYSNLNMLLQTPILFLFHGNITDVILYLLIFSDSFLAIYNIALSYVYTQHKCCVIGIIDSFNFAIKLEFIKINPNSIFHPPKKICFN